MIYSTKANEFASQCGNEFTVKLKFVWILLVLLLELSYFFTLLYLESSKKFSIIMVLEIKFIFHTLSLLGILVNTEGEISVVVVIFLYQNICLFSLTFYALT